MDYSMMSEYGRSASRNGRTARTLKKPSRMSGGGILEGEEYVPFNDREEYGRAFAEKDVDLTKDQVARIPTKEDVPRENPADKTDWGSTIASGMEAAAAPAEASGSKGGKIAGGALKGAASGAALGTTIMPGWGTLIGGGIGGIAGAVGSYMGAEAEEDAAEKAAEEAAAAAAKAEAERALVRREDRRGADMRGIEILDQQREEANKRGMFRNAILNGLKRRGAGQVQQAPGMAM